MFGLWNKTVKTRAGMLYCALIIVISGILTTTCNMSMGLGDPVDWEPPVLTLDPGPNPRYVNLNTALTGTVTDNVAVDRVICRDAVNPDKIYGTATINGDRWTMTLNFTEADNGNRIPAEIVAYDRMENSGEQSIKTINLIVDIHPPIFDEVLVWRSAAKTTVLESLAFLKDLETSDPRAERIQNVDRYQNGAFWIRAEITENETTVKQIELNIYDADYPDDVLYNETRDSTSSVYSPQWTIKETDLINRGRPGSNYEAKLAAGQRLYFRVEVIARDMSDNEKVWHDDLGYFCLYRNADTPKAILGGGMGQYVDVRTPLPVDIFDDDGVKTAYAALLEKSVFDAVPGTGRAKLEEIKARIIAGTITDYKDEAITDRVTVGTPDSLAINILAGENDSHYGDYVLIGIVEDVKTDPHDITDPLTRPDSIWGYYSYPITVTDNNSPLIVIDTVVTSDGDYIPSKHPGYDSAIPAASTGNSPEENTFPKMLPVGGKVPEAGRYFTINGYTLRANKDHLPGVGVQVFRMAWIPYVNGAQDTYLDAVKTALRTDDWSTLAGVGVQHWNLSSYTDTTRASYWTPGSDQDIGGTNYTKHAFFKQFDILGVQSDGTTPAYDDLNTSYRNFYVSGVRENEPKLFVFYAKDQDNHEVYRTIRLLGNKTPPALKIYDLTTKPDLSGIDTLVPSDYNQAIQATHYPAIRSAGLAATDLDLAEPFTAYPASQVHKLYITAQEGDNTGIQIEEIKMYNITEAAASPANARGFYNATNRDMTYVSALPDILQRTFLFTAKNRLGVEVQIQRTVAVTSTAQMKEIIADVAGGNETRYGAGTPIKLQAQFSMPVQVKTTGPAGVKPLLNIRYQVPSGTPGSVFADAKYWIYTTVPFSGTIRADGTSAPALYLDFDWTVPAGAEGVLETIDVTNKDPGFPYPPYPDPYTGPHKDRPLDLNGAQIIDAERIQDNAFLPGYILTDWHDGQHSLQGNGTMLYPGKAILLDGIKPVVTGFVSEADGSKAPYTGPLNPPALSPLEPANHWYFKSGEIIYFTLTASKPLRTSGDGNPRIQFQIQESGGTTRGPYYADYLWPAGSSKMVFAVEVDDIPFTAGQLPYGGTMINIALNTAYGGITDTWGNALDITAMALPAGTQIVVDKTAPPNATPRLRNPDAGAAFLPTTPALNKLNYNPILTIADIATITQEPWGTFTQYSLDDGLSWANYPDDKTGWTYLDGEDLKIVSSQWKLRTRQLDKAGNVSAMSPTYELDINGVFPKLQSVSIRQPNGIYTKGPIVFELDFEYAVNTTRAWGNANQAYIIVSDTAANSTDFGQKHTAKVFVTPKAVDGRSTLSFVLGTESAAYPLTGYPAITSNLNPIIGKQMPNGLTITEIHLNGDVVDSYLNAGVNSRSAAPYGSSVPHGQITMYGDATNNPSNVYDIDNVNGAEIRVFTIPPSLIETVPKSAEPASTVFPNIPAGVGNVPAAVLGASRTTIELIFDENVRKEIGTIHIKPHGSFPVPPVFPAEGYYEADGTYVESFYEVYYSSFIDDYAASHGNNPSAATLRNYLRATGYVNSSGAILPNATNSVTDMSGQLLTTGLDFGPYKLTTHGLKKGPGYGATIAANTTPTALYSDDGAAAGWNPVWKNAVHTSDDNFMVPDISGKYVLNYSHPNTATGSTPNATIGAAVDNIRTALNAAHYRWRDIDVVSSEVTLGPANTLDPTDKTKKVTITLATPLPVGFTWDLFYAAGTFTDDAGNNAPAIPEGQYWFWTDGVQKPVIRVNRQSMDLRTTNDRREDVGDKNNNGSPSEADFSNISYRMESETPNAVITYGTLRGGVDYTNSSMEINSWTGNISPSTTPVTAWNARSANTTGTWLLPNLLSRAITGREGTAGGGPDTGLEYNVTENGVTIKRVGSGNFWGFRSYNRDATAAQLLGVALSAAPTSQETQLNIAGSSLATLKASKNYVVAQASISHGGAVATSARGYEGIFKTVVALNAPPGNSNQGMYDESGGKGFSIGNGDSPQQILGSNNLNPTPSIPGFPMMLQTNDLRYNKKPLNSGSQLYWMSTEIVSSAYFTFCSPQNSSSIYARVFNFYGDAGRYLSGSYGDLTYSYNQDGR